MCCKDETNEIFVHLRGCHGNGLMEATCTTIISGSMNAIFNKRR